MTTSEPADFDTVKLEVEKSTNVSVKKLEIFTYRYVAGLYLKNLTAIISLCIN